MKKNKSLKWDFRLIDIMYQFQIGVFVELLVMGKVVYRKAERSVVI